MSDHKPTKGGVYTSDLSYYLGALAHLVGGKPRVGKAYRRVSAALKINVDDAHCLVTVVSKIAAEFVRQVLLLSSPFSPSSSVAHTEAMTKVTRGLVNDLVRDCHADAGTDAVQGRVGYDTLRQSCWFYGALFAVLRNDPALLRQELHRMPAHCVPLFKEYMHCVPTLHLDLGAVLKEAVEHVQRVKSQAPASPIQDLGGSTDTTSPPKDVLDQDFFLH
jgi:hypothetical protein